MKLFNATNIKSLEMTRSRTETNSFEFSWEPFNKYDPLQVLSVLKEHAIERGVTNVAYTYDEEKKVILMKRFAAESGFEEAPNKVTSQQENYARQNAIRSGRSSRSSPYPAHKRSVVSEPSQEKNPYESPLPQTNETVYVLSEGSFEQLSSPPDTPLDIQNEKLNEISGEHLTAWDDLNKLDQIPDELLPHLEKALEEFETVQQRENEKDKSSSTDPRLFSPDKAVEDQGSKKNYQRGNPNSHKR